MAVDYGDVRTGIACSDSSGTLAFPHGVIVERDINKVALKILSLLSNNDIELLVIGLPKNMDGTTGKQADKCLTLAKLIGEQTLIEVITWDERVTTKIATTYMNETDTRGKKRRDTIDEVAATVILQSYLDYRKLNNKG